MRTRPKISNRSPCRCRSRCSSKQHDNTARAGRTLVRAVSFPRSQSRRERNFFATTRYLTRGHARTGRDSSGKNNHHLELWRMIETRQLSKRYGDLNAVDGITFKVEPGQVLGFLGPNGAGKSTTMKMIAGFLSPTSGSASVCGHDVVDDALAAKRVTGYLPEGAPSYGEMTPRQFLHFVAEARGLRGDKRAQRVEEVIERLHLHNVLEQSIETLSKGFKRRVGLAQAIVHDPAVLILDEPTDGLDPNQKFEVRNLINAMAKDKTIVVSTHILEEVQAVCTRAVIIARGKILADATPAELEARSRYHGAVSLTTSNLAGAKDVLSRVADVAAVEYDTITRRLTAVPKPGRQIFAPISELLKAQDIPVSELQLESGRMDEVFRTITHGDLGEDLAEEARA